MFVIVSTRYTLPLTIAFPPISCHMFCEELVHWINTLQSESLDKVSFYTLTTQFAETLKNDPQFSSVQVTGHSLGGGR